MWLESLSFQCVPLNSTDQLIKFSGTPLYSRLFSSSVLYLTNLILTISVLTPTLTLRSSAVCSSACLTARLSAFVLVNSCIILLVLYERFLETENPHIQGYPQRLRLQRRLCETVFFLNFHGSLQL